MVRLHPELGNPGKESCLSKAELSLLKKLNSPKKIQDFLDNVPINFEKDGETLFSPLLVMRKNLAHCFEGALFAASALWFHGRKPLIVDIESVSGDDNHVVALFKENGFLGAISKTNHAVLRYREPVYRNLRELMMSYFHEYFTNDGKKTMRGYSDPLDLSKKEFDGWVVSDKCLWNIDKAFDNILYSEILSKKQINNLRLADSVEIEAGKILAWNK